MAATELLKVSETLNQWIQLDLGHGGKDDGCQETLESSGACVRYSLLSRLSGFSHTTL